MVVDRRPCQDGTNPPRQYALRGKHSSAIVGYTPLILLGIPTSRTGLSSWATHTVTG
ncbi:hypothetical protein DPMN_104313 [Dreissena polymorpha]|uniref:Uncharacterized protein n=1 Tax=Dreissena polymorpha TaxID=45954 RepID=A0A9D4K2P8_DREPO|nr:hypothetical protein DPMN_104313 [Dreissena polymorpha]